MSIYGKYSLGAILKGKALGYELVKNRVDGLPPDVCDTIKNKKGLV